MELSEILANEGKITAQQWNGLARRLANAGLRVRRSDRSETIYVSIGRRDLRISGHELGYADYGTRQQSHTGPEVLVNKYRPAQVLSDCIGEVWQWAIDHGGCYESYERLQLAEALRKLRAAWRRLNPTGRLRK